MSDILIHIIAYALWALFFLGIIAFVVMIVKFILSAFIGKQSKGKSSTMPWWVWWSSYHNH